MMMIINHHGGKCCAIKTIQGFGSFTPESILWAQHGVNTGEYLDLDAIGHDVTSYINVYPYYRPKETAGERLKAYVEFLREHRPCSIVEVCIVPYLYEAKDPDKTDLPEFQLAWVPFLENLGFKLVNSTRNSNSGNVVQIWHLNLDDPDFDNWGQDSIHTERFSGYDECDDDYFYEEE